MGNDIRFHHGMTSPTPSDGRAGDPHDSWAPYYEQVMEVTYGAVYARLTSSALAQVRRCTPRGGSIIDFGAGCGRLALPLAMEGYRVTAVEPSGPMADVLRARRAAMKPQSAVRRLRIVQARMQDHRSSRKHDLALCVFTVVAYLLHERALHDALGGAAHALAPGGLFLLDVPDRRVFTGFEHDDARMMRSVEIEPIDDVRYRYEEETTLRTSNGNVTYCDRFTLRRWSVDEVLEALWDAGFEPAEDVSASFTELGASYLLVRRSGQRVSRALRERR